jgi:hypothetical protein
MIIAAVLLVAGCATESERAAHRAHAIYSQRAYATSEEGKADAICSYRAQAATASRNSRLVDLEGAAMGAELRNRCMAIWRQTGQLP